MASITLRLWVAGVLAGVGATGVHAEPAMTLDAVLCAADVRGAAIHAPRLAGPGRMNVAGRSSASEANWRSILDEIAIESGAVLRDAGVALRVAEREPPCEPTLGSEDAASGAVLVRIDRSEQGGSLPAGKRHVAGIQFVGGRPLRTITLSLSAARYLMSRDPATRTLLAGVSAREADRWAGRMLGRALAHELGHYLLRSPRHSASGLMRATHTVHAFVRPDRGAFRLTAADRALLLAAHSGRPPEKAAHGAAVPGRATLH